MNKKNAETTDVNELKQVVGILTYLRSGSGLMSSLLDDHPNILTTPDDSIMDFYTFWENNSHKTVDELVSSFIDYYAFIFDARAKGTPTEGEDVGEYMNFLHMGPNRDEYLHADREVFKRTMLEIIGDEAPVSRKLFFQALHLAYAKALGRKVKNPIIVFGLHTIGRPSKAQKLIDDFPNALFLQMIRHPVRALGSHVRHHCLRSKTYPDPSLAADAIYDSLDRGIPTPAGYESHWRAVRLEDLHRHPRETMQKVCKWLNIPWDDPLLKSTFNGKLWWNEKNTEQVSGFSNTIISQRFEDYINEFDRFRLDVLYTPKCKAWGYPVHWLHHNLLVRLLVLPLLFIPFKMEFISVKLASQNKRTFTVRSLAKIRSIYLSKGLLLKAWIDAFRPQNNKLVFLE